MLVGETANERVVGAYRPGFVADCGMPDRRIFVLNGTGATNVAVRFRLRAACYGGMLCVPPCRP